MAKAKTINDVVEAIEALNVNLGQLLSVEQREERTGGIAGRQRETILDKLRIDGDGIITGLTNFAINRSVWGLKVIAEIDQMQVQAVSSGRSILGVIAELKGQKVGFIGGLRDNAMMQITAFTHGFNLQDIALREQLTVLDKAGQQGGQLLQYTNSLLRQGIPRDVAHDMLKNLARITLTNTQSAETLVKMLNVMAGVTPALTQLGFGAAPQDVLAELSRNLPGPQAVDLANTFKDIMTANLGGETNQWLLAGGEARAEELKTILLNIEKTGKATPNQLEQVASILERYAKDSLKIQTDLGVGLAGKQEEMMPLLLKTLIENNQFADQQTMARYLGTLAAVSDRDALFSQRRVDKESHIFTVDQSSKMLRESIVHIGDLFRELGLRTLGDARDEIPSWFSPLFNRLDNVNEEIRRSGDLSPEMLDRYNLNPQNEIDLFKMLLMGGQGPDLPEEEDDDPVTGTTQEEQAATLTSIDLSMGMLLGLVGAGALWTPLSEDQDH